MDDSLREVFVEEALPLAAEIEAHLLELERAAAAMTDRWRALLGAMHTLKGNCGMVGLDHAQGLVHAMEHRARQVREWGPDAQARSLPDLIAAADQLRGAVLETETTAAAETARLEALPDVPTAGEAPTDGDVRISDGTAPATHLRVPAARMDRLLDATADLAIWHQRLHAALRAGAPRREPLELADNAGRRLRELRDLVMDLRLVPLSSVLSRFDRMVRDLARATGKRVVLTLNGGQITVDKHVADRLGEPLLHVVRNAVDHGIETPRDRMLAGKTEVGTVTIDASASGGVLDVTVSDDGRGIDRARLAAAAARRGLDVTDWPADDVLDLVFAADVTTAEQVTTISGRGIGLDQARRALERIGGSITAGSELGAGARFHIRMPLVIAVQRSLLVRCDREIYGIPFTAVIEVLRTRIDPARSSVSWRGQELAACFLADELGAARAGETSICVVVARRDEPLAVMVDGLAGHQDLAIRELDPMFGRPRGITGAALLPDGRIVPVLEFQRLGRTARPLAGAPS